MQLRTKKNILICPLDWGLGHASRIVPIVELLNNKGVNVIIASDNNPMEFLQQRFPENTHIKLGGASPHYPENGSMALAMLRMFPKMIKEAQKANAQLQTIVTQYNIDAIISDNRYELSSKKVPSIFITHQLNIKTYGWQLLAKPIINLILYRYLKKFNEIWIPDLVGDTSLSGRLSDLKKFKEKQHFIGLLSRFNLNNLNNEPKTIDLLILLSGPEPQRTKLENILLHQALETNYSTVILLGKPGKKIDKTIDNVRLISHLPDDKFAAMIISAKLIISRPGYSTLMDLAVFNKKIITIPTPGQTEQKYLAERLFNKKIAYYQNQNEFNLKDAMKNAGDFIGIFLKNNNKLLENRVNKLLSSLTTPNKI